MDPIRLLKSLIDLTVYDYIREVWGTELWLEILLDAVSVLVLATVAMLSVIFWGWLERKVVARMQDRIGPNRVGGRYGQLQMIADVVKMITKEFILPAGADKPAFLAAPVVKVTTILLLYAVLPLGPGLIGVDLNVGLFYIMSISSISIVAFLLAGWGSNNKYALLGAFRAVAQLVSYEVPMILSLLIPAILAHTLSTVQLVESQDIPYFLMVPLAGLVFFISSLAETGRTPFDLLEAESEIIAGYHTEYSGMNLGLFLAGEYVSTIFMSALFVTAFWGGYRFFGLEDLVIGGDIAIGRTLGIVILFSKVFLVFFVFMWLRATLPRFRVDQLLNFNWKFMVPLALVLLFTAVIIDKALADNVSPLARAGTHLLSNLIIGFGTLEILRRRARQLRQAAEGETADHGHDDHGHDAHSHDAHGHDTHDSHAHPAPAH